MKKLISILLTLTLLFGAAMAEADDEYRMSALITSVDGNQFTVRWANGEQYAFNVSDDTDLSDLTGGLNAGKTAFISYTGQIDWENRDASSVHVDYISDGYMDEIDYMSGVVIDATMHSVTISWVNGFEYSFAVDGDAEVCEFSLGDTVRIGFIGMIDWENADTSNTHLVSIEKGHPETVSQVEGIVYDATMHTITIETDDGELYGFSNSGDADTSSLPEGVVLGERVVISFTGSLEYIDYAHMIAVEGA
ncbi:MAG: hypothetical protein Q4D04_00080 [Clostridia bacterium]|nr:hypothetical protein [Clostridia bacterium]